MESTVGNLPQSRGLAVWRWDAFFWDMKVKFKLSPTLPRAGDGEKEENFLGKFQIIPVRGDDG